MCQKRTPPALDHPAHIEPFGSRSEKEKAAELTAALPAREAGTTLIPDGLPIAITVMIVAAMVVIVVIIVILVIVAIIVIIVMMVAVIICRSRRRCDRAEQQS